MALSWAKARQRLLGLPIIGPMALFGAVLSVVPLLGLLGAAISPGPLAAIPLSDGLRYTATSLALAFGVATGTAVTGTVAAWLVTFFRFPGVRWFSWALALPLAVPAFTLAYAYADLLDVAGPVQRIARSNLSLDPRFSMRNLEGATFVLTLACYPYVYLAMRAELLGRSAKALAAARVLGDSPSRAFVRVALPLARPSLAAGVTLAVMETLADYGAVQFLAVQTLTTGVIRAWVSYGSTVSAAQFAVPLLVAAALLLWVERAQRRGQRHESGAASWPESEPAQLGGWRAVVATAYCSLLVGLGVVLPLAWVAAGAVHTAPDWARLMGATRNTMALGVLGTLATVPLAVALALRHPQVKALSQFVSLGYATPGAAMAIGLLAPATLLWRAIPGAAGATGSGVLVLVLAYAARLMAPALGPVHARLDRLPPALADAARLLGRNDGAVVWSVLLPLCTRGVLTAALVVFIDILKELPATLILRPFNFDTLAVLADNYARDERLAQAGWPSLIIVGIAVPATLWVTRSVEGAATGGPR